MKIIVRGTARARRAFTLIEILVVIALTGLLLALVLGPLIQGFRVTNRARAYSAAQEATRYGMEQIRRELSTAAYVYDNTNAPIILPLGPDTDNNGRPDADDPHDPAMYPTQNGYPNPRPSLLFGKIDYVPSATKGISNKTVIDPTTDKPLGGSPVDVPGAPGTRVVRLFVGLRNPLTADGKRDNYRNNFEFPRADSNLNPFILYRAEFDPKDPNLVITNNPDGTAYNPLAPGGFNDPNFFYNTNPAPNGRSFAQNWKDVATPILSTPNLDLIGWRRDNGRNLIASSPFQLNANFAPSTVLSDTATPGFLSNVNADAPGAVPTLYTAQNGLWTYPFTVTVYRAGTQYNPSNTSDTTYGSISFVVEQAQIPGTLQTRLRVRLASVAGSLRTPGTNSVTYWYLYDPYTGRILIHTVRATILIDPTRGRIETGFPPIQFGSSGAPRYLPYGLDPNPINLRDMVAGPGAPNATEPPNVGSLFPLVFRQNTLYLKPVVSPNNRLNPFNLYLAGELVNSSTGPIYVPTNQGINGTSLAYPLYFPATKPLSPFPPSDTAIDSPFVTIGTANPDGTALRVNNSYRGIMIAPGTETVLGPDNNLTLDATGALIMNSYFRVPVLEPPATPTTTLTMPEDSKDRRYIRTAPLNYTLEQDMQNSAAPVLIFDETPPPASPDVASGLPARSLNDKTGPPTELRVSYLWQNNYSRSQFGIPLNSSRAELGVGDALKTAEGGRPEADVIKLDYSTRALISVLLAPRVYDTSSGLPQSAQVNDRVAAGNVAR